MHIDHVNLSIMGDGLGAIFDMVYDSELVKPG